MPFTREQRQEAYQKLSPEVQSFIMDNETTELIAGLIHESGLSGEQEDIADSEILCVMYGLQTLSQAIENIARSSQQDATTFSKLKADLNNKLLSKMPQGTVGATTVETRVEKPQVKHYDSFEQTIIRQAQAMRPVQSPDGNSEQEKSGDIKQYSTGNDPYREPIE